MNQFDSWLMRVADLVTIDGLAGTVASLLLIWLHLRAHPILTLGFVPTHLTEVAPEHMVRIEPTNQFAHVVESGGAHLASAVTSTVNHLVRTAHSAVLGTTYKRKPAASALKKLRRGQAPLPMVDQVSTPVFEDDKGNRFVESGSFGIRNDEGATASARGVDTAIMFPRPFGTRDVMPLSAFAGKVSTDPLGNTVYLDLSERIHPGTVANVRMSLRLPANVKGSVRFNFWMSADNQPPVEIDLELILDEVFGAQRRLGVWPEMKEGVLADQDSKRTAASSTVPRTQTP